MKFRNSSRALALRVGAAIIIARRGSSNFIALEPSGIVTYVVPRLAMMMAAPTRKANARDELRNFIYFTPEVGDVLLWESWLRHEVPINLADEERISVSFNYGWG